MANNNKTLNKINLMNILGTLFQCYPFTVFKGKKVK